MTDKENETCPACHQKIRRLQTTEYDFCVWMAKFLSGSARYAYGAGRSRGRWYWSGDEKPMSATEIAARYIIPAIEESELDMDAMGYSRHWHNFRNVQGMYRILGNVAFLLNS